MSKSVFLVITSALAIAGEIAKAGALVEVTEREAVNFLHRGKARLATADDGVDVDALRTDGPTVAEYVAAGYPAANYPPEGYEARSTDDEILAAIAAEEAAAKPAKPAKEKTA